jgi:hypothetical protein
MPCTTIQLRNQSGIQLGKTICTLRFKLEENALSFIGRISEMKFKSVLDDNIEINELPETVLLPSMLPYITTRRRTALLPIQEPKPCPRPPKSPTILNQMTKATLFTSLTSILRRSSRSSMATRIIRSSAPTYFTPTSMETAKGKVCTMGSISRVLNGDVVFWRPRDV